jgi:choline dehydrogenase-like flavoprotein
VDQGVGAAPDPNYWADPYDGEMSIRGLRLAREIMRQPVLASYIAREVLPGPGIKSDDQLIDYACRTAKTDHHPVGTCKMGNDGMAVVSPDLKVRGIEGLSVCDVSIMPRVPSSNTNAPTIMVGEKGADLIIGREPLLPAVFSGNRSAA